MFGLEKFYNDTRQGRSIPLDPILNYLKSFDNIIIWGAGNLGQSVGEFLSKAGIYITAYWDRNYSVLKNIENLKVEEPFLKEYCKETTLIIPCIVNGSLGEEWTKNHVTQHGYKNVVMGMKFFAGVMCPFSETSPPNTKYCASQKECSLCNCEKYVHLLSKKKGIEKIQLYFQLITFVISTRCTLKCKYCGQFLNDYSQDKKINFHKENIKRDIRNFFEAVDFIGMVSVIGGEPFLHPNLVEIVEYMLEFDNIGIVNITTNGIFNSKKHDLKHLNNPQIKVSFSVYKDYLTNSHLEVVNKNIKKMRQHGITHSIGYPLWCKPHKLTNNVANSEQDSAAKKEQCENKRMCASVRDGLFLPCTQIEVATGLALGDYLGDCVDIASRSDLRERLLEKINVQSYKACRHCQSFPPEEILAGEQLKQRR